MALSIPCYYDGEKLVDTYQNTFTTGVLNCEVYERWNAIHVSSLSCGRKEKITITRTIGITVEELKHFESSIGGSIGISRLIDIKAELKEQSGVSLKVENNQTTSFETEFSADECGKKNIEIFQLVREYRFTYNRFQRYGERPPATIRSKVTEYLNSFTDITEQLKNVPECPCRPAEAKQVVHFEGGIGTNLNIHYSSTLTNAAFMIWGQAFEVPGPAITIQGDVTPYFAELNIKKLPGYILFLCDLIDEEEVFKISSATLTDIFRGDGPQVEMSIAFDANYDSRKGYVPKFLGGTEIALPIADKRIARDTWIGQGGTALIHYYHFSLTLNKERRMPIWVAANTDNTKKYTVPLQKKPMKLRRDTRVPEEYQITMNEADNPLLQVQIEQLVDFQRNAWGNSFEEFNFSAADTFHFTNCVAIPKLYVGMHTTTAIFDYWQKLEEQVVKSGKMTVFSGPVFRGDDPIKNGIKTPMQFWKIIVQKDEKSELNVSAFLLNLQQRINLNAVVSFGLPKDVVYPVFATTVETIAQLTGIQFDYQLYRQNIYHPVFENEEVPV